MLELVVDVEQKKEKIILIENGKMIEYYTNDDSSRKTKQEGNIYVGQYLK